MIAMLLQAALLYVVAYGLWMRWRLVRLILLVLSWYTFAICLALGVTLATWARINAQDLRREPLWQILAIAAGGSALALFHIWLFTRPAIRESFERRVRDS
ncbi:MAG: hypothetical protein HY040_24215 [Planctomycetes bacterium]|nr:hypothetical protein [Planctomycetota bacterium]